MKIELVDPKLLEEHKLNVSLYGDPTSSSQWRAFVEDIKEHGVLEPIRVAADGKTIVSGHRRWRAAIEAGLTTVPVIIDLDLSDELAIVEALLSSNIARRKSPCQLGKEYLEIL